MTARKAVPATTLEFRSLDIRRLSTCCITENVAVLKAQKKTMRVIALMGGGNPGRFGRREARLLHTPSFIGKHRRVWREMLAPRGFRQAPIMIVELRLLRLIPIAA